MTLVKIVVLYDGSSNSRMYSVTIKQGKLD